jgi:hypothetical protein
MSKAKCTPRRPFVRNHFLPHWVHRFFNAAIPSLLIATALLMLLSNLWIGIGSGLVVFIVLLLVNPDRLSFVEGVAGEDGYCDLNDHDVLRP